MNNSPCSKCGKPFFIVNKTHNLCADCNHIRLHGETRLQSAIKKQKTQKRKLYKIKPSKKRKETLEKDRDTYFQLFNKSNCECEECTAPLPTDFEDENGSLIYIHRYSHILGKKAYPEYRNELWNFNELCLSCHQIWDFGDKKSMKIYNKNKQTILSNTGKDILQ